jgi:hypothetical protein
MALSLAKDPGHISFLMTASQPLKAAKAGKTALVFWEAGAAGKRAFAHEHDKNEDLGLLSLRLAS